MELINKLKRVAKKAVIVGAFALSSLFSPEANAQTFFPPLDAKINMFRQPPTQEEPILWDTLMTRAEMQPLREQYFNDDQTDTISIKPNFVSGDFAMQVHINFYGTSGFPGNVPSKYNSNNLGKYKVPVYIVDRIDNTGEKIPHGLVVNLGGNNLLEGNIENYTPLDFFDLVFIEPRTDQVVQIGDTVHTETGDIIPLLSENSTVQIKQVYWFGTNEYSAEPFLTFNIVNGVPQLASYDTTRLVLERNFRPEPFGLVSPTNGTEVQSCNDAVDFAWTKSKDRDISDIMKYKLIIRNKNTGLETIFSDITDTTYTLPSRTLTRGNFEWYVEASDGKEQRMSADTLEFIVRNTAPTANYTKPVNNETVSFENGMLKIKYVSEDADNDPLNHVSMITGPKPDNSGQDTTYVFTTAADSVDVAGSLFKLNSNYTLEGKVTDGIDTTSFTSPIQFRTPTITGIEKITENIPKEYALSQNYPNPFNPETKVRYSLPKTSLVSLKVYNMLGQEIETLVDGTFPAGEYEVDFSAKGLASGVYFFRLRAGEFAKTNRMLLAR